MLRSVFLTVRSFLMVPRGYRRLYDPNLTGNFDHIKSPTRLDPGAERDQIPQRNVRAAIANMTTVQATKTMSWTHGIPVANQASFMAWEAAPSGV